MSSTGFLHGAIESTIGLQLHKFVDEHHWVTFWWVKLAYIQSVTQTPFEEWILPLSQANG